MSIFFNPDEILEMAEQIEKNGARFYRKAAEKAGDRGIRTLLQELAAMEDGHEKIFAKMRAGLAKEEIDFNADEQAASYLKAWAGGHVFNMKADPVRRVKSQKTMEGVLNAAIGLEKESIVFYLGLKDGISKKSYRKRIEEIIKEEMKHITYLSSKLASLKKKK